MTTRASAKAKMDMGIPGNPASKVRNPYVDVNPKRNIRLLEKPAADDKRSDDVPEINLYGP